VKQKDWDIWGAMASLPSWAALQVRFLCIDTSKKRLFSSAGSFLCLKVLGRMLADWRGVLFLRSITPGVSAIAGFLFQEK